MRTGPGSSWWRALFRVIVVLVAVLAALSDSSAQAQQPEDKLADLPQQLRKYVPDSPQWRSSPWMTAQSCRDRGGDFSVWVENVIHDAPALQKHFYPTAYDEVTPSPGLGEAMLEGYRRIAEEIDVPDGYCVDDVKQWVGADDTKPFGFPWGLEAEHRTVFRCTTETSDRIADANLYFGAERGPCDGFYLACAHAESEEDKQACKAWNAFSDEYVRQVEAMRAAAWEAHPPELEGKVREQGFFESFESMVGGWFEDLTRALAMGAADLMAEAMTFWTQADRTDMLESPAIVEIQKMLRYVGIALLVGSMIWQGIVLLYRRKADPLVNTGLGLLSFVGWSTAGGAAAVLLNEAGIALANDVLDESIASFATTVGESLVGQVSAMTGAIFFLAIIMFFLACIQWVLGFFRMGALVILLALLPTAAAGQLNDATKPWLRKVLSWCLSLILYQPIAAIVFAIGLQLIGHGEGLSTVLVGISVIALAVISMPTMLRFFDWGGQKLVNSGSGGAGMAALGSVAMIAGGRGAGAGAGAGASGFSQFMNHHGPAATAGRSSESSGTGANSVTPALGGDGPADRPDAGGSHGSALGAAAAAMTNQRPGATTGHHDVTSASQGQPSGSATGAPPLSGDGGSARDRAGGAPDGATRVAADPQPSSPPGLVTPRGADTSGAGETR